MRYEEALPIAQELARQLDDHCQIVKIAGSVRRLKPEVKDIELCVMPKRIVIPEKKEGLFGDIITPATEILSPSFTATVNNLGVILKGKTTGRYMQIMLPQQIKLDLFIPETIDFVRQFTIRTGSAEWVQKKIAVGWRKIGWVGTEDGLRKDCQCEQTTSGSWKLKKGIANPERPPIWQDEKEFFKWLGIDYVKPINRKP